MYIKAKRCRETKYKAKAAFRNPRGELRDRDDLKKQQETRKKIGQLIESIVSNLCHQQNLGYKYVVQFYRWFVFKFPLKVIIIHGKQWETNKENSDLYFG